MKSIGQNKVNIRQAPSLKADIAFQAHLGYPVEVEKKKDQWVLIKDWQGNTGWVYRPLVADIRTAVVLEENVNVRSGPGLKHRVVMQADRGQVYKIFAQEGKWVQIGYYLEGEKIGWIRQDLVWGE
ncbi:MAG: SH3 domain-containing protein [Thermodesulfobacteriota bacterium]